MEKRNNLYNCQKCGNTIVTEDKAKGVTPATLPCENFGGCADGRMFSMMYNVPPILQAAYYWVAPKLGGDHLDIVRKSDGKSPFNI